MKNHLFNINTFAKMNNVNKRTLHYYDEVNIFTPALKKENGYRYYNVQQIYEFQLILWLRELGMSIEEIKYIRTNSTTSYVQKLIVEKINKIDDDISRLQLIKRNLNQQKNRLANYHEIDTSAIIINNHSKEYIHISPLINNQDNAWESSLLEFIDDVKTSHDGLTMVNQSFGTIVDQNNIFDGYSGDIKYFYIQNESNEKNYTVVKPKGKYLQKFSYSDFDSIKQSYAEIKKYIEDNNLTIVGDIYESGYDVIINNNDDKELLLISLMII